MWLTASPKGKSREKWLRGFARIGLGSYGIVYCLMSLLSVMAAGGFKKETAGKTDAFKTIYDQPFGKGILLVIGVSILGYVLLRLFQAFGDTRHEGKGTRAILIRLWMFSSALVYLGLSYTAISLAVLKPKEGDDKKELIVGKLLDLSWGPYLVGAAGLIFIGSGLYQVYRGASRRFMKYVDLHDSRFKKTFVRVGIVGHIARGVVFCTIGYLIIKAAIHANSGEAKTTDGAFDFLKDNFGDWPMGLVALGLLAYGIFMLVRARHEKMNFDQQK